MKSFLPKSEFRRNVITLMTGTAVAQAIPIAISPVLTRIFTPEDFGLFALYMALASIIGVVAAGRYELAIMLPKEEEDAFHIVCLSVLITSSIALSLYFIVFFFNQSVASFLKRPEISPWLYLLPVSVMATGCYQALNFWNNRRKSYQVIAMNRVVQSGTTNFTQFTLGSLSASSGLIWGSLIGQAFALFFLVLKSLRTIITYSPFSFMRMVANAKRYKKFPIVDVPTALINLAANQAPNILLATLFTASSAGHYYMTQRVLQAPITLISGSVLDVFKQRASEDYKKNGHCKQIFKKTFLALMLMALPPSVLLYIWIEELFALVFGASWRVSGEYSKLLIPALFLRFIVNPLSFVIYISGKQFLNLLGMITLLLLVAVSVFVAETTHDAVFMISMSFVVVYLFYLFVSAKLAGVL